ncbi:hypothetical protein HU200_057075 [Digitaria exilis]|uniref:Uncharacterized protein n=1 Tax=Digitaria exilis TaxID=1010633 RepID=A0A835E1S8_9POAL|nr:hypothetical protein HU200_057075 [Digitaria exilis]
MNRTLRLGWPRMDGVLLRQDREYVDAVEHADSAARDADDDGGGGARLRLKMELRRVACRGTSAPSRDPRPSSSSLSSPAPVPSAPRNRVAFIPSAPSIDAGHFSLDFLPNGPGGRPWRLVDSCGSLLLLATQRRTFLPDLIVCEPISRVTINPIEEDMKYSHCLGVFLDRGYYVRSISSFSVNPPWNRWQRHGWSSPRRARSVAIHVHGVESAHYTGRSKGYIFWGIQDDGSVFAVKEGTGELSHFRLPENIRASHDISTIRFVDDGGSDGLVRLVSLIGHELRVFLKREHNNGGSEWVLVRSLHLAEATIGLPGYKERLFSGTVKIVAAGKGYVALTPAKETWLFSVELGTMQVEREHIRNRLAGEVYPYELRLRPKVRACVFPCKRGRDGLCYQICKCE